MRLKILPFALIIALLLVGCGKESASTEIPTEDAIVTDPTLSAKELEVQRVSEAVKAAQSENSFTFLAISDTCESEENTAGNKLAGEVAARMRDLVDFDFAAHLGGIAMPGTALFDQQALQCEVVDGYLKDASADIPFFVALSSYDSYPVFPNNNPTESFYAQDLPDHKIRIITLNTGDGVMSAQQLQWFAQSLDLSEKPDAPDWGILILSHMPLDFGSLLDTAGRILDGYLSGTAVSLIWEETTIEYDFTDKNGAEIIGNIHGYSKCLLADNLYLANENTGMYRSPIVRICIPNAGNTENNRFGTNNSTDSNGIEYGETTTWEKVPGTEKATAFNVVTIDREKKVISCINYGAGYDREISYGNGLLSENPISGIPAPAGEYTNQVPLATEFGRRNNKLFNEVGYRNHTYLVCNDISEEGWPYGHDAQYVTTGAIPFTVPSYLTPPTIYIWGAELDEAEHTRFFIYDSQKYRLVLQATGAEFKNYFTIEELGEQYYKLTPIPEGKASVLFPATNGRAGRGSIAFSLKGTGENLVITVGEPIIPE